MKSGRLGLSIFLVAVLVLGTLTWFVVGLKPLLGLDLKGGLSVTLQGPSNASKDVMQQTVERIQERVDALGVAEPDISLLGSNVVQVQLPGVGSPGTVKQQGSQWCAFTSEGKQIGCYATQQEAEAKAQAQSQGNIIRIIGTTARLEERPVIQQVSQGDKAKDGTKYEDIKLNTDDPLKSDVWVYTDANGNGKFDEGEQKVQLGPVVITGANLKKATATFLSASQLTNGGTPGWRINFSLDKEGAAAFATATTKMAKIAANDPTKQLAIVVDKAIISSPEVQGAITGGTGEITGNFTEAAAKNLAVVLQSGALPVTLKQLNVETVSPTLGQASLREGVIAGLVGLVALALYLAFYYRLLGMVTWVGMAIWATLAFGLLSILGKTVGYALTLAGVAGIIVSLGITADSYIVFYERLKDEVRHGKTVRAAVQPAFKRSWRTIVAADGVTVIAAAVLYVVSIGSVRGFALTLGLCTLLDLFVVWFFKRPTVFWMARNPYLVNMKYIGLEAAVGIEDQEPAPTVRAAIAGGSK